MLSGCAMTDNLATYNATVSTPNGGEYAVHNKHGSLLTLKQPDGTEITADDRGHPAEQGMFGKLVDYATIQAASDID
jgi:hypothetical protein